MFSKLGLIILVVAFALVPVSSVQANSLIPNETHYYTVQLRSDKRALNYARIVFENKQSEGEQDTYKFSMPKGLKVQDLSVQQVLAKHKSDKVPQPCMESSDLQSVYNKEKVCTQQDETVVTPYDEDYNYSDNISSGMYDYRYYDYYDRYNGQFDYSDLKLEEKDGEYTAHLSNNVKPGRQGSVLVSYVAENLVNSFMGRHDYNYQTLVSKNMISSVTVAINFDEEMYSREAKQKRAVETSSRSSDAAVNQGVNDGAPAPSRSTDNLLFNVGRGGVYTKTQSNLLPGDVMSVKGMFAEHPILLFTKEIFITLLAFAAVVIWTILGVRHYRRKHLKTPKNSQVENSDPDTDHLDLGNDMKTETSSAPAILSTPSNIRLGVISLVSFFAALVVGVAEAAIVAAIAKMMNAEWGIYPLIQVVWVLLSYIFIAFLLPVAYVMHFYSAKSVLRWTIIHLAVFTVLGTLLMIFGFMILAVVSGSGPESYPY